MKSLQKVILDFPAVVLRSKRQAHHEEHREHEETMSC